ncbi:hypothetical protein Dimus_011005 [Dionaea muscipula]
MGDDMLNIIIEIICVDRDTPESIVRKNLEPHLYLFHVWILENILPKVGHLDAVTPFECYILYCFETEVYLDLPYIIMKEIIRIREAADDSKALCFGAMLAKIFKAFDVDLEGEVIFPTKGPINSISVTSSKISEKIAARERHHGNPIVDDKVAPPAPAAPVAPAPVPAHLQRTERLKHLEATQTSQTNVLRSFEVEQIRVKQVHGQIRFDITHSEEHVRADIDELTQLICRCFPSPSDDP